jgi:hypothetical protein
VPKTAYDQEARELLEQSSSERHARDFAYFGETPIGETWAWAISRTRDSDLLDESNWETITADMKKRFPKDVRVEEFSHWAVGWIKRLAVRMLNRSGGVTAAGKAIIDWKRKLDDYPVADEEDYSRRDYESTMEHMKDAVADLLRSTGWRLKDDLPEGWEVEFGRDAVVESDDGWPQFDKDQAIEQLRKMGLIERS